MTSPLARQHPAGGGADLHRAHRQHPWAVTAHVCGWQTQHPGLGDRARQLARGLQLQGEGAGHRLPGSLQFLGRDEVGAHPFDLGIHGAQRGVGGLGGDRGRGLEQAEAPGTQEGGASATGPPVVGAEGPNQPPGAAVAHDAIEDGCGVVAAVRTGEGRGAEDDVRRPGAADVHQDDPRGRRRRSGRRQGGGAEPFPTAEPLRREAAGVGQRQVARDHQQPTRGADPGAMEGQQIVAGDRHDALRCWASGIGAAAVGGDQEHPCRDRAHVRQSLRQGGRGPLPLRAELRGIQRGPEQGVGQQLEGERGVASDDVDLQRELIGVGYRRQRPADGLHRLGDGLGIAPAGTSGEE